MAALGVAVGLAVVPAGAQSSEADAPVFAVALGSSFVDVGAATLLVAAGQADAVLPVERPDAVGATAEKLIARHGAQRFVVVGGTAAVSSATQAELAALAPSARVSRLWGADRAATAAAVSRSALESRSAQDAAVVAVANGRSPADVAAAAAAVAAGAADAVLWSSAGALGDAAADVLRSFDTPRVLLIGGTAALSEQVAADAAAAAGPGAQIQRVGGATRADTAVMLARVATAGRASTAVIADGWDLSAVVTAGALAAATPGAVVLFADAGGTLGSAAARFVSDSAPQQVLAVSAHRDVRDELARSAKLAAPRAQVVEIADLQAAVDAAVRASRQPDTSGGGGGSTGGGADRGATGPGDSTPTTQPPPTTDPYVAPAPPPTGVIATAQGHDTVVLNWDPYPADRSASELRIWWSASSSRDRDSTTLVQLDVTATSYTVTGLSPGTSYRFQVGAYSSADYVPVAELVVTTCGRAGEVTSLAATSSGTTVTVTWRAPTTKHCTLTGFDVEHRLTAVDPGSYTVTRVDASTLSHQITGLANGTWGIRVKAVNEVGDGGYAYTQVTVGG